MSVLESVKGFVGRRPRFSLGIAAVILVAAIGSGCNGEVKEAASLPDTGSETASAQVEPQEKGVLSFTLEDADGVFSEEADGGIVVLVEGADADGNAVSKQYVAVAGQRYDTDLGPGTYTVSLASRTATQGSNYFKASPYSASFDGVSDCDAVLRISLDQEAIDKAAQEKREAEEKAAAEKAAAEETAKKEAEEKAAAEAAAKKEAEEKAAAEARAAEEKAAEEQKAREQAQQQEKKGSVVYVASSGNGKRYHSNPNCSNMKRVDELSKSEAESRGYTPCKKCY